MRSWPLTGILLSALVAAPAQAADATGTAHMPAWDYIGGANDDEGWAELSPAYALCGSGNHQSPVDIQDAKRGKLQPLAILYREVNAIAQLREQALVVQLEGGTLRDGDTEYALKQLRLHSPAEHSIQGETHMLEIQFIHQSADGKVLIVAALADVGAENAALAPLLANLPSLSTREKPLRLNAESLLPAQRGYFAYEGSLTWPPCTEGVQWRVMKTPLTVSKDQAHTIATLLGRNARLPQPLYLRSIQQTTE